MDTSAAKADDAENIDVNTTMEISMNNLVT